MKYLSRLIRTLLIGLVLSRPGYADTTYSNTEYCNQQGNTQVCNTYHEDGSMTQKQTQSGEGYGDSTTSETTELNN